MDVIIIVGGTGHPYLVPTAGGVNPDHGHINPGVGARAYLTKHFFFFDSVTSHLLVHLEPRERGQRQTRQVKWQGDGSKKKTRTECSERSLWQNEKECKQAFRGGVDQSFVRGSSVSARRGAEAAGLGGFSEGRNWPRACLTWEDAYGRQGRVLNQFLA